MSPVLAFLALIAGLALGVLVLGSVIGGVPRSTRVWLLTTLGVILAVMVVPVPAAVRDRLNGARNQGRDYRSYDEQAAHRKCLLDFGRPDLVGMVDFVQSNMPPDSEFRVITDSPVTACLAFNLLPRRPVVPSAFNTRRHWVIYDRQIPADVQAELRDHRSMPRHSGDTSSFSRG